MTMSSFYTDYDLMTYDNAGTWDGEETARRRDHEGMCYECAGMLTRDELDTGDHLCHYCASLEQAEHGWPGADVAWDDEPGELGEGEQ